jgi:hypothetical protein
MSSIHVVALYFAESQNIFVYWNQYLQTMYSTSSVLLNGFFFFQKLKQSTKNLIDKYILEIVSF